MVPFHGKGVTGDHIPVPVSVSSHAFHHSGSELRTAEDSSSEIVVCWPDLVKLTDSINVQCSHAINSVQFC